MSPNALFEATIRTLGLGIATAVLSGTVGLLCAWLVTRTDFTGRRAISSLLSVPYALPSYLLGMAWIVLGNPTVGLLKDFLPPSGAYGFWGMVWVESSVAFAFPYLELRAGFDRLDPALEEAARMSGSSPVRVFRDVSLPLLWPSLVNGMCLAFLYAISAFGVPALLGMPVREFTLTTLIYSQIKLGGLAGIQSGLQICLILLVLALGALGLSWYLTRLQRRRGGAIAGAKSSRPSLVALGNVGVFVSAGLWGFLGLVIALPWIALGMSALAPVAGKFDPALWTLSNFHSVLTLPDFQNALVNSTLLTVAVATLVTVGGFLLAFAATRQKKRWAAWLIEFLGIPFATPGTVLAIAVIFAATLARLDEALLLLAFAYSLKYAAVGARALAQAFPQVHPALEEAARISGASKRELLLTIWLPLLAKNLRAAWILAALPMFTELTMSVLLTGPGAQTLGTVLFDLQEYRDQPSAAALAWLLLTLALGASLVLREKERPT